MPADEGVSPTTEDASLSPFKEQEVSASELYGSTDTISSRVEGAMIGGSQESLQDAESPGRNSQSKMKCEKSSANTTFIV
jgi:hypothetical protein